MHKDEASKNRVTSLRDDLMTLVHAQFQDARAERSVLNAQRSPATTPTVLNLRAPDESV